MIFQLFSDEQRRLLANLAQYYDAYMEAERAKLEVETIRYTGKR